MSFIKGKLAEDKAVDYLQKNGFIILDRNFHSRFGEVDIIAVKNQVLHFVEVKSGNSFEPIYNITPTKITKIIKTIDYYLHKKQLTLDYFIDALIIKNDIELIENITI